MRHAAQLFTVLLSVCLLGCGGADSHEKAAADMVDLFAKTGNIIAQVKDKASAEAANEKLASVADDIRAVGKRIAELGDPGPGFDDEIKAKYADRLKEITDKLEQEMKRITQIDFSLLALVGKGMQEIEKAMDEVGPEGIK